METARIRPTRGPSQVMTAVKVLLIWFFVSRAIFVVGVANKIPPANVLAIDALLFGVTALYVCVRETISEGINGGLFVAVMLTAGGVGIFSTLTQNPSFKNVSRKPTGAFDTFYALFDQDQKTFSSMAPVQHLSQASRLIFENPTRDSLAQARKHLRAIPTLALEYASAQSLMKAADAREHLIEVKSVKLKPSMPRAATPAAPSSTPVEVIDTDRTKDGWRVTVRNNTTAAIRHIRLDTTCFTGQGWQIEFDGNESELEGTLPSKGTFTFTIDDNLMPPNASYALFEIVGFEPVKSRA
jgi:hypothetical protein